MIGSSKNMEAIIKAAMTEKGLVDLCSQDTVHEVEVSGRVDFGDVFITIADMDDRSEAVTVMMKAFNDDGREVFDDAIINCAPCDVADAIKELLIDLGEIEETPNTFGGRV